MSSTPETRPVLIVGCGDIGQRVACLETAADRNVIALARSEASAQRLAGLDIRSVPGDLDDPASLSPLRGITGLVYYFAPPPASGFDDPRMEAFLTALNPDALPDRIVYISTSGVYGDGKGAWMDEDWPLNPASDRGKRRLAAETRLLEWGARHHVPVVILRSPGIYGPGRLPLERIRKGIPVLIPADSPWSNRIHADDLASACFAAARRGTPGHAYNATDGHPTTMTDYFWRIADCFGLPRPPAIRMDEARTVLSANMLSFLTESRRLSNRRLVQELGITLRYPDLDSGLMACKQTEQRMASGGGF